MKIERTECLGIIISNSEIIKVSDELPAGGSGGSGKDFKKIKKIKKKLAN